MKPQILVPLDGSALAEAVVPHAATLARLFNHALLLLHVVTPAETNQTRLWSAVVETELRREWEQERLTDNHTYLAALATRLQAEGLEVRTEVLSKSDVAAAIVGRAVGDQAIALIAMTTHGRSGIGRLVLGSVAEQVLHATPAPLLLLRARKEGSHLPATDYRSIVVPLDGSAFAEQALAQAQQIAAACGADLILVSAVPAIDDAGLAEAGVVPYWMEADCQAKHEQAERYLMHMADRLATEGQHVHTRLVTGSPAEMILNTAVTEHADLIVMATHGHSGFSRLRLGSVAAKMAQEATVPLLLVRAQNDQAHRTSDTDEQLSRAPPALFGDHQHAGDAGDEQGDRHHRHQHLPRGEQPL